MGYTGKDKDRLGRQVDGLFLNWTWQEHPEKAYGKPNQVCHAKYRGFYLRVIHWADGYESSIEPSVPNGVARSMSNNYQFLEDNAQTRVMAQLRTEQLVTWVLQYHKKTLVEIQSGYRQPETEPV